MDDFGQVWQFWLNSKLFIYLNHLGNMEFEIKFFSANKFILSLHKKPLVMHTNKPKT